ncbi:helix-turn-helix domain-containing protein [Amycolatopsis solani]|uniref:helix-turn-helix domain-containing protein n=1 Tax=Amycolatopsis solani TaxID=3028615 RepID=UPI0025AEE83D|nr:helix-turn-helix transcriptional regulator [Amycolatopsis sp. MEP2-6]
MTELTRAAEFGDTLAQLRSGAKLTGRALAARLGWDPSKVSRIETGQKRPTEDEVKAIAAALGLSSEKTAELVAELKAIRLDQARWKARLRAGGHESTQVSFAAAERSAATIINFEVAVVPGLVQIPAYARAVFEASAKLNDSGMDIAAAVAARMKRQDVLYDESKDIYVLTHEMPLRSSVAPAATLTAQRDRLVSITSMQHVKFGILPMNVQLPIVPLHGFWLLDDLVIAETVHTEVTSRAAEDVRPYRKMFDELWPVAVKGAEARALLLDMAA